MNINAETDFLIRKISIENLDNMLQRDAIEEKVNKNEEKTEISNFEKIKESLGNLSGPTQTVSEFLFIRRVFTKKYIDLN